MIKTSRSCICDRCCKEIPAEQYHFEVTQHKLPCFSNFPMKSFDLCEKCSEDLVAFMMREEKDG